ncbi:MAG: tetratricopeptide repeat protein, partial [Acidobacteria bacterium]|nr:tetratricopeptide repeat protein [Acidobacteriota bacterium]
MARITCVLLLALPVQALLAQSPPEAETFDRTFSRALEMQKAGDYVGAIETYKAALTIDPKRVDALSNLGAAYVHLGQFEDAIAQYKTALAIDPGNAAVRMYLSLASNKSAR